MKYLFHILTQKRTMAISKHSMKQRLQLRSVQSDIPVSGLVFSIVRHDIHAQVPLTKLLAQISCGRSSPRPSLLSFFVYFTRIFQNPNTGKFSAWNEKKYYHMQSQCISNLGQDPFSNLKPPFNVNISRLSIENRAIVRTTFPDVTFVEDIE